ncbi:MAG: glycosyltransferase, partial [Oscillospiraceae bacterium]|nr:glycosyltransferase [Oscillospiraceae bacterium]
MNAQKNPAVSVIVPVYNAAAYLPDCLASVAGQSFCNFELLLIDDGSTDESPALCDSFAQTEPRARVLHQANAGPSLARNAGIDAARGTYITFVDADDWLHPHMLARLVRRAEDSGAELVQCRAFEALPDGTVHKSEIYAPDGP